MKDRCLNLLRQYTGHKYVSIVPSGNSAVFAALLHAKMKGFTKLTIQDQGGWLKYEPYAKLLGLKLEKLKTDFGLIKDTKLKKTILLYTTPAGYFAEQDMKNIYENCKDCFVIADVAGWIGQNIDGKYADMMVGSFGRWKPVNVLYGGFISSKEMLDKEILSIFKVIEFYAELYQKLEHVNKRYEKFFRTVRKIKKDLAEYDIIHKDKAGINVVIRYKNSKEKNAILEYCKRYNFEYTECPRDIRVNVNAISIEVKRL